MATENGPSFRWKVIKTICAVFIWVCLGLIMEITGPSLKDLKLRTNSDYEEVSRAVSGLDLGALIGCLSGGVLVDRFPGHWDLIIAVFLTGSSAATVAVPWTTHASVLWILFTIIGSSAGIANTTGQKIIMKLWGDKAASPLHLIHWGYGIGSFIVPQIVNPFLAVTATPGPATVRTHPLNTSGSYTSSLDYVVSDKNATGTNTTNNDVIFLKESRIEWGFGISASSALIVAVIFYFYQFSASKNQGKNPDSKDTNPFEGAEGCDYVIKMIDPKTCTGNSRAYGVTIILLMSFFLFNIQGGERAYGKFLRSFAIDELHMDGDAASWLNTSFWISFSFGRFLFFVLAKFIRIRPLILMEAAGALIFSILVCFLGNQSQLSLWILTQPLGIFIAPLYPSLFGWAGLHLRMTGIAMMVVLIGGSAGGIAHLFIIGHFYEHYGYNTFLYHMLGYGIVVMVMAVILHVLSMGKQTKPLDNHSDDNKIENHEDIILTKKQ